MNEQLQAALTDLVNKISSGVDFAADKLPQVLQQLLAYELVIALVLQGIGLFLIVAALLITQRVGRWYKVCVEENQPWLYYNERVGSNISSNLHDCVPIFRFIIPGTMVLAGIILVISNFTWIKIIMAPDVYLLDYIRGML